MIGLLAALASFAGVEVDTLVSRLKRDAIAIVALASFLAVAILFALVAIYAGLSAAFGPVIAALLITGVALLGALITYLVMLSQHARSARRASERRHAQEKAALITAVGTAALPLLLQSSLVRRLGLPIGGLLAAGYLLSRDGKDGSATNEDDRR